MPRLHSDSRYRLCESSVYDAAPPCTEDECIVSGASIDELDDPELKSHLPMTAAAALQNLYEDEPACQLPTRLHDLGRSRRHADIENIAPFSTLKLPSNIRH